MIVQLTGTLAEVTPANVVLDVGGVGFELGVSSTTAYSLPPVGTSGVRLLVRMVVREDAMTLFGFASREERMLFDRLCAIPKVGPKLALSVLSTFTAAQLADVAISGDAGRMATVPGVGKKLASRLILELQGAFTGDLELMSLVGTQQPTMPRNLASAQESVEQEVTAALLSMGFTQQEASLAMDGFQEAGATTVEKALAFALKRLGGGR